MDRFDRRGFGYWVLAVWAAANIYSQWNSWSLDASALYFSAYFYDLGRFDLVYSPEPAFFWEGNPPGEWVALAEAQGASGRMVPFVYPPLWAAVLAPLAASMKAVTFFNLFHVVNTAAIAGSVWLAHGLLHRLKISFFLWCVVAVVMLQMSMIGLLAITLNQPQIIVTFLILAAFWALAGRRDITAGGLLALAAAIKVAPGMLAIIFIMERRWKALAVFGAVGVALLGLSLLLAGPELHRMLIVRLRDLDDQVLISRIAVTLDGVLVQIANGLRGDAAWGYEQYVILPEPVWVGWVTRAVLLGGLIAVYFATRALGADLRLWFRLQLVFLVVLVTGPLAWVHYLILPLFLLPGLIGLMRPAGAAAFLITFTAVFSTVLYGGLGPQAWGSNVQIFSGFGMVLATFALLIGLAARLRE